jgi:predicted pyridoxine 5'-phosphate oxidase superfamily flavin-nucleotide-binding protein
VKSGWVFVFVSFVSIVALSTPLAGQWLNYPTAGVPRLADGTPNLSPKGTTAVWDDDHLMFADIRSPQSVQNIERNPSVEVNVVDPLVRKGYRFKGQGAVHRSDEVFQRGCQIYGEIGLTFEIRAVVLIRVERALPLISPAYDRGESEEQVKDRWRRYWRKLWEGAEE